MKIREGLILCFLLPLAAVFSVSCGSGSSDVPKNDYVDDTDFSFLEFRDEENVWDNHFDSMPDGGRKLKVGFRGSLGRAFNDSNHVHLEVAEKIGISPIVETSDILSQRRPLLKIASCPDYFVDNLTHSFPFLVPEAKELLGEIGKAFRDTLSARGGGSYRVKVTSVLRTPASIARLRRRNRNSVANSAHQYGTTFDISYTKFICDTVDIPRTQEDLKNLLGEILVSFRDSGKCYVKYERKQGCYHITARPKSEM